MAFHVINRKWMSTDLARTLKIKRGWINEFGTEVAGNGRVKLFSYEQFLATISLHRYLCSFYSTIEELKSHRFFSPRSRTGDPGVLFMLPLVEHAVFNDICLTDSGYWLEQYRKDPIKTYNNSADLIKQLGLEDRDEWSSLRRKLKATESFL